MLLCARALVHGWVCVCTFRLFFSSLDSYVSVSLFLFFGTGVVNFKKNAPEIIVICIYESISRFCPYGRPNAYFCLFEMLNPASGLTDSFTVAEMSKLSEHADDVSPEPHGSVHWEMK